MARPLRQIYPIMWKDSTARKILIPPPENRPLLWWSAGSLLIAVFAAIFGWLNGASVVAGVAKMICFGLVACSVVLAGIGFFVKRRAG
jgi:hypothetical protein